MSPTETFRPTNLTLPMILVGTLLGTLVYIANMYFGLQIGALSTMNTSTVLISFAIFESVPPRFITTFSPTENVIVQTIASSIAGMPVAASFTSIIPAFESLRRPEEGGARGFSAIDLMLWSLGVAFFGTVFAASFRALFICKERLRFPSGYATGVLIGVLHQDAEIICRTEKDKFCSEADAGKVFPPDLSGEQETESITDDTFQWRPKIMVLLKSFGLTAVYVIASYFIPQLTRVPIFGIAASEYWLWFLTLSPAFTSFGMVLDPHVALAMMFGAVIGWGVFGPIAKHKGWAPGPVGRMENGVRGRLLWVCIGLLLGDAFVRLVHGALHLARIVHGKWRRFQQNKSDAASRQPLLARREDVNEHVDSVLSVDARADNKPNLGGTAMQMMTRQELLSWLTISTTLCIICTFLVYGSEVPIHMVIIAIVVSFPLCLIVIQSAGETDIVPSISLSNACQFLFVIMLMGANRTRLTTMIAGGITEAGLWQSAVLMTDLKTAYLVQASPKVMFHAQLLGSSIGVFVGSGVYKLFRAVYDFPSETLPVPLAYMWANTARLANGGILPHGAWVCMIGAFILSGCLRLLSVMTGPAKWKRWVPSGVAMSIGMYVPPSITLAKLVGASIRLMLLDRTGVSETTLMAAATGCILGEGTLGFLPGILSICGIPRIS